MTTIDTSKIIRPGDLDTSDPEELMAFWLITYHHPIATGRILFPERPDRYVAATTSLGLYASNKATAIRCRLQGDISTAQMYEGICDRIYSRLPAYAK